MRKTVGDNDDDNEDDADDVEGDDDDDANACFLSLPCSCFLQLLFLLTHKVEHACIACIQDLPGLVFF